MPPVFPTTPAPAISFSGPTPSFSIPSNLKSRSVLPVVSSRIPVLVPLQLGTDRHTARNLNFLIHSFIIITLVYQRIRTIPVDDETTMDRVTR